MAIKKFRPKDVLLNTMKTHPRSEFFIFDGKAYYNNTPEISGTYNIGYNASRTTPAGDIPQGGSPVPITSGYVSLYEMNIDRISGSTDRFIGGLASPDIPLGAYTPSTVVDNGLIYPWIIKDGSNQVFNKVHTASYENYYTDYEYGEIISSSYAMSASITREYMSGNAGELMTGDPGLLPTTVGESTTGTSEVFGEKCATRDLEAPAGNGGFSSISCNKPRYRHYWALKPTLDSYGYMSEHFKVTASVNGGVVYKDQQEINLISIPSIFYGTKIKPGTVSLRWYFTGSLAGELQDTRQNGELIQVTGSDRSDNNDKVAGVVLYNEGFILLTGSWGLNAESIPLRTNTPKARAPSWLYFGAGAADGVTTTTAGGNYSKASFILSFKGTTEVQTVTMFAHAQKGQVNYSNNPTYLNYSSSINNDGDTDLGVWVSTSSFAFEENTERSIVNFVSSSALDHSASFKRQVYIGRVGIYDDNKNLIGVATLSNPVRKEEDEDLTFKLKLDI